MGDTMTKDTKKSKLKEMFKTFNRDEIASDKRAQDILNAIRNSKKNHELRFATAAREAIKYLTQSELHRVVANEADWAEKKTLNDLNG